MSNLQNRLFLDRQNRTLFDSAKDAAHHYIRNIDSHPVFPSDTQLKALEGLATPLPEIGKDSIEIIQQLAHLGEHTTVKQTSGRYFGFVNGNSLPVGQAAQWLSDIWDQNAALYVMSPLSAKLEEVCQQWLRQVLNLPQNTVMGLVTGTSIATLCALAAARYQQLRSLNWDIHKNGLYGAPPLRIILGRQSHGTVVKMLKLLGFGEAQFEWVDCDNQGRLDASKLPQLDQHCILILQAGNVCSGAFDNFADIIPKANASNCWVHVDGAFGLWAAASPEFSQLTDSVQLADSWSVDGHKTLNIPYDCGIVLCKHEAALIEALHQQGSYIQTSNHRDNMQYTPDMSRRARGVELWACLLSLGTSGVAELVELLHARAKSLAERLRSAGFCIVNEIVFNQVMVRGKDDNETAEILTYIQSSGDCWCGAAQWFEHKVIRISLCSWATTEQDLVHTVDTFLAARESWLSNRR